MTDLLCLKCNNEIFKNSDNLCHYLDNIQKEIYNNIYKKTVNNKIDLCNVDKILNYYIEIHNNKYNIYFVKCSFDISFDDNDIHELETTSIHNKEIYKLNIQLLFFIDTMKSEGKNFNNITRMTIIIYGDKCYMTDKYSKYMRFSSIERRINQISGKYPNILKNNILIRNKSHIIFNI